MTGEFSLLTCSTLQLHYKLYCHSLDMYFTATFHVRQLTLHYRPYFLQKIYLALDMTSHLTSIQWQSFVIGCYVVALRPLLLGRKAVLLQGKIHDKKKLHCFMYQSSNWGIGKMHYFKTINCFLQQRPIDAENNRQLKSFLKIRLYHIVLQ